MLRRWNYSKNYLDIVLGALGINKNMTCFFSVPTNPWAGLVFGILVVVKRSKN